MLLQFNQLEVGFASERMSLFSFWIFMMSYPSNAKIVLKKWNGLPSIQDEDFSESSSWVIFHWNMKLWQVQSAIKTANLQYSILSLYIGWWIRILMMNGILEFLYNWVV